MRRVARERPELVAARARGRSATRGPIAARRRSSRATCRASRGQWWDWSDVKRALEWLFWSGRDHLSARRRNFERLYDLPERVLPQARPRRADARRRRRPSASCCASPRARSASPPSRDLRDYFRLPAADAKRARRRARRGRRAAARSRSRAGRRPGLPATRRARSRGGSTRRALLGPFDSLIWERARAERLFGFRYRIEIYVPEPKRVHGYYVLPFLLGDRLVARVDLKADRPGGRAARAGGARSSPEAPPETADALARRARAAGGLARARRRRAPETLLIAGCWNVSMPPARRITLLALALVLAAAALAPAAAPARTRAPHLADIRCLPVHAPRCAHGPAVPVGARVLLRGHHFYRGMRVVFRWPKGALATSLQRTRVGWAARVPAGVPARRIWVYVRDRSGRRSHAKPVRVIRVARPVTPPPVTSPARGLPAAVLTARHVDLAAAARARAATRPPSPRGARAAGIDDGVRQERRRDHAWSQFSPTLVAALHAQGLRVCAWQYVYGANPMAEAQRRRARPSPPAPTASSSTPRPSTRAATPRPSSYITALRAAVGADYPLGLDVVPLRRLPPAPALLGLPRRRAARSSTRRRSTGRRSAAASTR